MGTLTTFMSFFAFVAASWAIGADAGLVIGLLAAFAVLMRYWGDPERRVFEPCVFALFSLMALYDGLGEPMWTTSGVLVRVEVGMLLCIFASVLARRPSTQPAARALIGGDTKKAQGVAFLRINDILCAAWALAFTSMIAGELMRQNWPDGDPFTSPLVMICAVSLAEYFCRRYVQYGSRHLGTS